MIYIFDIDGTLADLTHRLHFIQGEKKDWDAFYAACVKDAPIHSVITVANSLACHDCPIILITGRPESTRQETMNWLAKNAVLYSHLYMRVSGDHRQDAIVKRELLSKATADGWNLAKADGVFEDRQQCVDMYRNLGYKVFQVAEGKY